MLQNVGKIIKGLSVLGYKIGEKIYWKTLALSVKFNVARDQYRARQGLPKIPRP